MKKYLFCLLILILPNLFQDVYCQSDTVPSRNLPSSDSLRFSEYFTAKTLRIDYFMAGNNTTEKIYLDRITQEPNYGGPKKNLIDPFNMGSFRITLRDSLSGRLIFSRGFSNLFQEWQTTEEAKKLDRAFSQCAVMPFPLKTVKFSIEKRQFDNGKFSGLFELYINPSDYFIIRENPDVRPVVRFRNSGDPAGKVDIAFVPEGYTEKEMPKFLADAYRIGEYLLSMKPFSDHRDRFNFYAIQAPSAESGVDIPGDYVYVNTNINSSFYTFDTDRYMTTSDSRSIYDIAANVPYDAILILVNSKKYGGGGFFNYYAETTVDNLYSNIVAVHEFGHSFAGLADEYVGNMNFSDFYNIKTEPWEPNITTNIDFDSKWKSMVLNGTPLPTPREEKYINTVGMFEGGGYMAKDIYSPMMDCRMNTNEATGFCPVCQAAIIRMIRFFCEE